MSPKVELVTNWLRRAREDLESVRRLLSDPDPIPNTACFHAQQTVEKALKCYLQWHELEKIPRTHRLQALVEQCEKLEQSFDQIRSDANSLTPYAVEVRYESSRLISCEEARDAFNVARRVVAFVGDRLSAAIDRMIEAEEQVEEARASAQMSALRAELAELKGEASGDKESK